jgi:hypothetical protein
VQFIKHTFFGSAKQAAALSPLFYDAGIHIKTHATTTMAVAAAAATSASPSQFSFLL